MTSVHISPRSTAHTPTTYRHWLPKPSEIDAAATDTAERAALAANPNLGSGVTVYANYMVLHAGLAEKRAHRLRLEARKTSSSLHGGTRAHAVQRGKVQGFSQGARSRLIKRMLAWHDVPDAMITLTYPDEPHVNPKRDLDVLKKRLARLYPEVVGIWRVEWVPRKSGELRGVVMPHFHLILKTFENGDEYQQFKEWLVCAWSEIARRPDWSSRNTQLHLRRGCNVQRLRSARGAMSYAAKYLAKPDASPNLEVGRMWGLIGKPDCTPILSVELPLPMRNDMAKKLLQRALARCKDAKHLERFIAWERYRHQRATVWNYGTQFGARAVQILLAPRPANGKSVIVQLSELLT